MKRINNTKKIFIACGLAAFFAMPFFAQEVQKDTYEDSSIEETSQTKEKTEKSAKKLSKAEKKLAATPIDLGTVSLFEYNLLNTDVEQDSCDLRYTPADDEFTLRTKGMLTKVNFSLDKAAREKLRKAVPLYLSDFENKRLVKNKPRKTANLYGQFIGHLRWGVFGSNGGNETKPEVTLGYMFINKSPYFTISIWPAEAWDSHQTSDSDVGSDKITLFFTKAQISEVISYMDEEKFASYAPGSLVLPEFGDSYSEE